MTCNVYCPFCGIILLSDPYYNPPESPPRNRVRSWYAEVRGIYSTDNALGHIATTGLGLVRVRNTLFAPLDSNRSYLDVEAEILGEWGICHASRSRWCFGVHNSCWRLLLRRLGHTEGDDPQFETSVAEPIFYLLYCTPCVWGFSFYFGHDYEGAAQTHVPSGRIKAVDPSSPFYADPCAIPSNGELEATASDLPETQKATVVKERDDALKTTSIVKGANHDNEGVACTSDFSVSKASRHGRAFLYQMTGDKLATLETRSYRIFDRLSPELKLEIFSYLSFDELLKARLVCRDLTFHATLDDLPQSYWRNRFLLGQEADFLFPNLPDRRDWRRLYFGTQVSLRAGLLPLLNRKRIRQLLEPIAALVELEPQFRHGPHGSVSTSALSHIGDSYRLLTRCRAAGESPQSVDVSGSFSGQLACSEAGTPLNEGCRALYHRIQSFKPSGQQHRQRIGISIIRIGTRSFVSGLNLFAPGEGNLVGSLIGYHIPASEKWIEVPPTSHIEALCVAFCSEGLTGIKFLFANSASSSWIGDSNGPGIAHGTLSIPKHSHRLCVLADFDRFKVVSLGFGDQADDSGVPKCHRQTEPGAFRVQSRLWTPHIPTQEDLRISTLLPSQPPRAFAPLVNMDFGGARGLLLGSLTRLTFHMAETPRPLIGIEIFYSSGGSTLFGSNSGCAISLFINGSKGERINGIGIIEEVQSYDPEIGLGGIQISTNYGRTAKFAPLRYRLRAAVDLIPLPPPANTITGFVALEKAYETRFIQFGIQSQQCDEKLMVPDILDRGCHDAPDEQLRYDEKFTHFIDSSQRSNYQTYASLKGVRKIQASTGIQGRSRSSGRISGLKLEYYNHPSPRILGQWMKEQEESFELSRNEEVRSLDIWLTPMGFSSGTPLMEIFQVVAIRIETTHSRSVTFGSSHLNSLPARKQRYQYQSDSDGKLTAISWLLNLNADSVRGVKHDTGSRRAQILVPEIGPPVDQVQKLYFETQDGDGCKDTVVTAEAYFQGWVIVGLSFVYMSGRRASVGDLDYEVRQRVRFAQDTRIVGLDIAATEHELLEIGFEVEKNQQRQYHKLKLSLDPPREAVDTTTSYEERHVWHRDEASVESFEQLSGHWTLHHPPDESRLIGIYVRCQNFASVGAVYEPCVSQRVPS